MTEDQNPWWFHEENVNWEEFEKLECRIIPKWISRISLTPFSLNFILGLRCVGKTMGIKLLVRELLQEEKNPYAVFYFDCGVLESCP